MKKTTFASLMAAALLAAPAVATAQQAAPSPSRAEAPGRGWGQPGPLRALAAQQAELGLTAGQVAQLEAIQQRLESQNRPLVEQLRAAGAWQGHGQGARERSPEQREQHRQKMREGGRQGGEHARAERRLAPELQPVARQMRENARTAMQEARAVLTPEQQARARELAHQRRAEAGRGARGPRGTR